MFGRSILTKYYYIVLLFWSAESRTNGEEQTNQRGSVCMGHSLSSHSVRSRTRRRTGCSSLLNCKEGYSDHDCVRLVTNQFVRIFFDTRLQQEQGLFAPCCDRTNDNPIHTHKTMLEQEYLVSSEYVLYYRIQNESREETHPTWYCIRFRVERDARQTTRGNTKAGIRYEFDMMDNGCNSLLLLPPPFSEPASHLWISSKASLVLLVGVSLPWNACHTLAYSYNQAQTRGNPNANGTNEADTKRSGVSAPSLAFSHDQTAAAI